MNSGIRNALGVLALLVIVAAAFSLTACEPVPEKAPELNTAVSPKPNGWLIVDEFKTPTGVRCVSAYSRANGDVALQCDFKDAQ